MSNPNVTRNGLGPLPFTALLLAGAALIALGAAGGLWYVPFAAGLGVGGALGTQRLRAGAAALLSVLSAAAGWAVRSSCAPPTANRSPPPPARSPPSPDCPPPPGC